MTASTDPKYERVERAFGYLYARATDGEPFSIEDVMDATGWKRASVTTYMAKQWRDVLVSRGGGRYGVKPEFRRLTWGDFKQLTTQKRKIFSQYQRVEHARVVTYEFLLPLTKEDKLRTALDDLFYTDTISRRLSEIGTAEIEKWIEREPSEGEEDYLGRACATVSEKFGGYSVMHVAGRFRGGPVKSRNDAAEMLVSDQKYLIDETTAVVRFIIPVEATKRIDPRLSGSFSFEDMAAGDQAEAELGQIRAFFFNLFAEAIVRTVQGEDEIWLLEDTGVNRRLYVWERSSG
jgi:hypothetical protein